jgi:hypothetical protein
MWWDESSWEKYWQNGVEIILFRNFNNLSNILKNKNESDIYRNLGIPNTFLFNNINREEKDQEKKNHLDKGFILENSHNSKSNSETSKKDEKIYNINKKIESIKQTYITNNIS